MSPKKRTAKKTASPASKPSIAKKANAAAKKSTKAGPVSSKPARKGGKATKTVTKKAAAKKTPVKKSAVAKAKPKAAKSKSPAPVKSVKAKASKKSPTKKAVSAKKAAAGKKPAAKKSSVKKPAAKKPTPVKAAKKAAPAKSAKKVASKKAAAKPVVSKAATKKKVAPKKAGLAKPAAKKASRVSKNLKATQPAYEQEAVEPVRKVAKAPKQSPADLAKFKGELLILRRRLHGDVSMMSQEALGPDDMGNRAPLHPAEVGTHSFEQEFTLKRLSSEGDRLELIDAALAKIADGTYGACDECGGRIPKGRLEAIPDTPFCVKCASKLES